MAIIKSKHASNFTVVPNDVFKLGLSLDAIGLLTYLLSLPHDWVVYKTLLHNQLDCGKSKIDKAFKELQKTKYVQSLRKQNQSGKIEYEHIVYDKPYTEKPYTVKPYHGEPSTVEPCTVKQQLLNTNITKETIQKKDNKEYQLAVDFWLKDFKHGWTFTGTHGKALKQILTKLHTISKGMEQDVNTLFVYFCTHLPEWYKDKDLPLLNSKFNEIITEIKTKKNGNNKTKSKFNNI